MVNTYAWMIDTDNSKIIKRISIIEIILKINKEVLLFINKKIRMCPAIILAVSRIANVSGRITFLIVSIIIIKGINARGVLRGIKWANIFWVKFIHPKNIRVIQIGNENEILNIICLEAVKI